MRAGFLLDSSRRRKKGAEPKGSSTSSPGAINKAAKEGSRAKEVASFKRLDTLPQELWEKILDELDGNDLFPLALSCRYFRQKQKELLARTRQGRPESGKPRPALKRLSGKSLRSDSQHQLSTSGFVAKRKDRRMTDRTRPSISGAWRRSMATFLCCVSSSYPQKPGLTRSLSSLIY